MCPVPYAAEYKFTLTTEILLSANTNWKCLHTHAVGNTNNNVEAAHSRRLSNRSFRGTNTHSYQISLWLLKRNFFQKRAITTLWIKENSSRLFFSQPGELRKIETKNKKALVRRLLDYTRRTRRYSWNQRYTIRVHACTTAHIETITKSNLSHTLCMCIRAYSIHNSHLNVLSYVSQFWRNGILLFAIWKL